MIPWSGACRRHSHLLAASFLLALVGCGGGADGAPRGHNIAARDAAAATVAATIERRSADRDVRGHDAAAGNAGSTAPAAPALKLLVDGRQLRFSWTAARTATHYKLFANADGASGFTQAGGSLAADSTGAALGLAAHHDWDRARFLLEACNDTGCTASNPVSTFSARSQAAPTAQATRARVAPSATATASADTVAGRVCVRCPIRQ
jgi:hypothetical protein